MLVVLQAAAVVPLPLAVQGPVEVVPVGPLLAPAEGAGDRDRPAAGDRPPGAVLFPADGLRRATTVDVVRAALDRDLQLRGTAALEGPDGRPAGCASPPADPQVAVEAGLRAVGAPPGAVRAAGNRWVGCPEAAMAVAVATADLATGGEVVRGRVLAAAGRIDAAGTVYTGAPLSAQVSAAVAAGAQVLVVPFLQHVDAFDAIPPGADVELVAARSVDDALATLREGGGLRSAPSAPVDVDDLLAS